MARGIYRLPIVSHVPAMPCLTLLRSAERPAPKRLASCGHLLPPWIPPGHFKLSLGPAMPYHSTPYGGVTSETAIKLFQGWPLAGKTACGSLTTPLDTPCCAHLSSKVLLGPTLPLYTLQSANPQLVSWPPISWLPTERI
jgi:hypothetical protein